MQLRTLALLALLFDPALAVPAWAASLTERADLGPGDVQANGASYYPTMSANGRYVAFDSRASNLVTPGWVAGGGTQIFVRDRKRHVTALASPSYSGRHADGSCEFPAISADGLHVAFGSYAGNLVPGDYRDGFSNVYIRDLAKGVTTLVSVNYVGDRPEDSSDYPYPSADGRYVAFYSEAYSMIPDGTSLGSVYVRDLKAGKTRIVSAAADGTLPDGQSIPWGISNDGRYVLFTSYATNLVAGGNPSGNLELFLRDLVTGAVSLVSAAPDGSPADKDVQFAAISGDGRTVAFSTDATNLVPGVAPEPGNLQARVRDLGTGTTTLASVATDGGIGNGQTDNLNLSGDGHLVTFAADATNLVRATSDHGGSRQYVYVRDLKAGITTLASVRRDGQPAGLARSSQYDVYPSLAQDGRSVAFDSNVSSLVAGDTNGTWDIFVHKLGPPPAAGNAKGQR